jgi:hypothetical protein
MKSESYGQVERLFLKGGELGAGRHPETQPQPRAKPPSAPFGHLFGARRLRPSSPDLVSRERGDKAALPISICLHMRSAQKTATNEFHAVFCSAFSITTCAHAYFRCRHLHSCTVGHGVNALDKKVLLLLLLVLLCFFALSLPRGPPASRARVSSSRAFRLSGPCTRIDSASKLSPC